MEGTDESDPCSGRGWIKLKGENEIEGEFKFHDSDNSTFLAKRAKQKITHKKKK